MALKNSGYTGQNSLHDITGSCDLCGLEANSEVSEVVGLDCSFQACPPEAAMYHQACLEKYLKSIRLERNRKIGFPCPRGCGKATKYPEACRGKVLKSHPVMIRSEANKKRRQAELEQLSQVQAQRTSSGQEKDQESKGKKAAKKEEAASNKGTKADKGKAKGPVIKALNVANTSITSLAPPKSAAQVQKEQLAAAARSLKNEITGRAGSGVTTASSSKLGSAASSSSRLASTGSGKLAGSGGSKEVKTLDEYLAERGTSPVVLDRAGSVASSSQAASAAPACAWGRSRANSQGSLQEEGSLPLGNDDAFPAPSAAASAGTAGRPPLPPRTASGPAPVAAPIVPQGAWAARPGDSGGAGLSASASLPLPAAGADITAALGASTSAGVAHDAGSKSIPGLEGGEAKLTKAQRKNLRRAEKKAAAASKQEVAAAEGAGETGSVVGDTAPADADVGTFGGVAANSFPLLERSSAAGAGAGAAGGQAVDVVQAAGLGACVPVLVQHKLQSTVEQLQALGFEPGACLAAVQAHGSNLEAAIATLLEQTTGVVDNMHSFGVPGPAGAEVDVSEELARLQGLQERYGLPAAAAEALVVECRGDLEAAERALAEQHGALLAYERAANATPMAASHASSSCLFDALPAAEPPAAPLPVADGWGDFSAAGYHAGASGASSAFSAFGFSGLTEAAVQAVRGAPQQQQQQHSLFSSVDSTGQMSTPAVLDRVNTAATTSGLWSGVASPSAGPSLGAQSTSDVGVSLFGTESAFARGPGLGLFGDGSGLQSGNGGQSLFDSLSTASAAPFPGAASALGGFSQHQLGGYSYGASGLAAASHQDTSAASLWGSSSHPHHQAFGQPLEESELNQLMATLGCR